MALFFPDKDTINLLKNKPTQGELYFLDFLEYLDDTCEVYFQPMINGDRPDIIILKKNRGLIIVEIKDWDTEHYYINNGLWYLKKDSTPIRSPLKQVETYKNNIFNLHIENLLEKQINDSKIYSIVSCLIYFHNANRGFIEYVKNNENKKHNSKFFPILTKDTLTKEIFNKILDNIYFTYKYKSKYFNDKLYEKMQWLLKPSIHSLENTKDIKYNKEQSKFIESKPGKEKIESAAGSGKTIVLAKRAVNAHIRTGEEVLILTFNITLRNYIHDRISEIRKNISKHKFLIIHYHQFIKSQCNNYEIYTENYDDLNLFENVRDKIRKYSAIFIDEGQDFEKIWFQIIEKYFLETNGEFVVFGDNKQNIYNRKMNTTIHGRPKKLNNTSYRYTGKILQLLKCFQIKFYNKKYELDNFKQEELDLTQSKIYYYYINHNIDNNNFKELFEKTIQNIIDTLFNIMKIHHNDICFIGNRKSLLREIETIIKKHIKHDCVTTFISEKTANIIEDKYKDDKKIDSKKIIKKLEKSKKFNFWMNPGNIKISTTHSFKGWESENIVLIIDNENKLPNNETDEINEYDISTNELVYTGLSRCKQNLIILNINNNTYHDFFINSEASSFIDKK